MLLPKSSCVCMPCFKPVAPRVYLTRVPFLAFIRPDIKNINGRGHTHVLKRLARLY